MILLVSEAVPIGRYMPLQMTFAVVVQWRSMGNHGKETPRSPVAFVSFQRLLESHPNNFRTFVNAVMNRSISSCVL